MGLLKDRERVIHCPAGQWTKILSSFAVGLDKDWTVTFAADGGGKLEGETLEQKSKWIFPGKPHEKPLAERMVFQRDWINAIYWVKVKPTAPVTATIKR